MEREVLQAGDAAVMALEREDREIWVVLTDSEALFDETTPEMRKRADELGVRWCEIMCDMATSLEN